MDFNTDHFTLFNLPRSYRIDNIALDQRYREIQTEVHPDRFAAEGAAAQRVAMQWAVRVNEAYQRLSQTEQQRESLRRQVVENTRNLHRAVNTDVEQVQARKQSIISNQSALEATEIGYQVGTRNIVDVLDATTTLYNAKQQLANARYTYLINQLNVKSALGTLNE